MEVNLRKAQAKCSKMLAASAEGDYKTLYENRDSVRKYTQKSVDAC